MNQTLDFAPPEFLPTFKFPPPAKFPPPPSLRHRKVFATRQNRRKLPKSVSLAELLLSAKFATLQSFHHPSFYPLVKFCPLLSFHHRKVSAHPPSLRHPPKSAQIAKFSPSAAPCPLRNKSAPQSAKRLPLVKMQNYPPACEPRAGAAKASRANLQSWKNPQ